MRSLALLLLIGCAHAPWSQHGRSCLRGVAAPEIGRPGVDEAYAMLWREHARAAALSSPVMAGRIVEKLPSWILDASDLGGEPTCGLDLIAELHGDLDHKPIAYTRLLVAQVRAVGRVADTHPEMTYKAAYLMAVADLPDAALTDYQLDADEPGPPPPKSFVRELALGYLGRSNLGPNVEGVNAWVERRLAAPHDDRDELLLHWYVATKVGGHVTQRRGTPDVAAWIADTRARLDRPADPVALEVVLARLDVMGPDASSPAGAALIDAIVTARGKVALTAGIPGGDRDLLRAAVAARLDAAEPPGGHVPDLAPLRHPFDPWADWLDQEPANARLPASTSALRLAELDRELARATRSDARCVVLAQIPPWVVSDADARFDALVAPARAGDQLRSTDEAWCRMAAALALDGVSPERRARLLLPMLTATPLAYESRSEDDTGFDVIDPATASKLAANQMGRHPEWITDSLRPALVALATSPLGGPANDDEIRNDLQPAFERLLAGAEGNAIARAWIADVPRIARDPRPTSVWPSYTAAARILALAEAAPRLGLADEARAMFAEVAALPPPSEAMRYTHPIVVRAAKIALATM